ncbi:MAG: hypothetical protein AB1918_13115 [Pseudomonadota bacterium]
MSTDDPAKQCRQCQFFIQGECSRFARRDERSHAAPCPAFNRRLPDWGFFVKL